MRYGWNEEQLMFSRSLRKFVAERCDFEARRKRLAKGATGSGFDAPLWNELADMGALGLPFAEDFGGSGGSALDVLLVMENFGRGLIVEPFLPTVVLGGGLLRLGASPAQQAEYIPRIIAGELRLALGFAEPQSRFNLANVATTAKQSAGGYLLNGHKSVVYGAPETDWLLITARTAGGAIDRGGISVFLVAVDAPGVELRPYHSIDGTAAAEVFLKDVRVAPDNIIGEPDAMLPVLERVFDEAISALCGEAVGAMAALNEKCVEYAKTRHAFGKAIADFQVISHRLVDMEVAYEQAAAIAIKAACLLRDGAPDASRTVSAAKVKAGQEGMFIGKHAVQLHGAIGITEELDIGHYFKRLTTIQTLFGSTDFHLRRYIALRESSSMSNSLRNHTAAGARA